MDEGDDGEAAGAEESAVTEVDAGKHTVPDVGAEILAAEDYHPWLIGEERDSFRSIELHNER